jgi:hypothetical protein
MASLTDGVNTVRGQHVLDDRDRRRVIVVGWRQHRHDRCLADVAAVKAAAISSSRYKVSSPSSARWWAVLPEALGGHIDFDVHLILEEFRCRLARVKT